MSRIIRTTRKGVKLPRRPLPPPSKVHQKKSKDRKVKHKRTIMDGDL